MLAYRTDCVRCASKVFIKQRLNQLYHYVLKKPASSLLTGFFMQQLATLPQIQIHQTIYTPLSFFSIYSINNHKF